MLRKRPGFRPKRFTRGSQLCKGVFTEFCHPCNIWVLDQEKREDHCKQHLTDAPIFCGLLTFRHLLISPGLCPFCLGDEKLSASTRLQHWSRKIKQQEHIEGHLAKISTSNQVQCPHPKCTSLQQGRAALKLHFSSVHSISAPHNNGTTMKKRKSEILGMCNRKSGIGDA